MSSTGETISERSTEPDHLVEGRSGSSAKNMLAAFTISLTFRSSAFSRCNSLVSAAASVVSPDRLPWSTSLRRCYSRNVSGLIPSMLAMWRIALMSVGCPVLTRRASAAPAHASSANTSYS